MLPVPEMDKIYRGFIVGPAVGLSLLNVNFVEYQYAISQDDSIYTDWAPLGTAYTATGFKVIHPGLFDTIFYTYRYRLHYTRGVSDWSDNSVAGFPLKNTVDISSLDELATDLGVITSGILRGIIFETSATNPKVRMDPTGFFATDGAGNRNVDIDSGGNVTVTGDITGSTIEASDIMGSIITGGRIQTDTATPNIVIDSSPLGLTITDSVGTDTFNVDASGNVTVTGDIAGSSITGSDITGGDITGSTIQTSLSNPMIQLDSTGIRSIDAGGAKVVQITTGGGAIDVGTSQINTIPDTKKIKFIQLTSILGQAAGHNNADIGTFSDGNNNEIRVSARGNQSAQLKVNSESTVAQTSMHFTNITGGGSISEDFMIANKNSSGRTSDFVQIPPSTRGDTAQAQWSIIGQFSCGITLDSGNGWFDTGHVDTGHDLNGIGYIPIGAVHYTGPNTSNLNYQNEVTWCYSNPYNPSLGNGYERVWFAFEFGRGRIMNDLNSDPSYSTSFTFYVYFFANLA